MKGDFSKLQFRPEDNFTGVWHQQGRVLLDQDWNADTQVTRHLRELLGRDTIGQDVVAIPASQPGDLQVLKAHNNGIRVELTINPGRAWLDGLHLLISGTDPQKFLAEYYGLPLNDPQPEPDGIADGIRDAVILEVWEEAFSAFQDPTYLLEPALGGPDTTERSKLQFALRLLRLEEEDDCGNLGDRLDDDLNSRGRLTVTPASDIIIAGDCPVEVGGGYNGFEHYLFRVEVAEPDETGDPDRIKWSRFNGGLVGRGTYDTLSDEISLTANNQMINHCGLTNFYLEALAPDPDRGHWRVVFSADASLVADDRLTLSNINTSVGWPGTVADPTAFFRLWDGVRPVSDFPTGVAEPTELVSGLGIRLELDAPAVDKIYRPGDYWTFPVRAAGVDFDPTVWPNNDLPQGIQYHRAPLAILNWTGAPENTLEGIPDIHDCRHVFQPLTRIQTCCTFKVGDGLSSFGDFDTIQEAVNQLPEEGGEICILPGTYLENITVDKSNVRIHGCGVRSHVIADSAEPVFEVPGQHHVTIEGLRIDAHETGIGVLATKDIQDNEPHHIHLEKLLIHAATDCAIKILDANHVWVTDCQIVMEDIFSEWAGLFSRADDVLIEHNTIVVEPSIPVVEEQDVNAKDVSLALPPTRDLIISSGRGGMHIAGTSERVEIIDNKIAGGIGNGITLGSLEQIDDSGNRVIGVSGWIIGKFDPCDPCGPGGIYVTPGKGTQGEPTYESAGALYDIRIERNQIRDMGLNGIGVVAFFDLDQQDEFISVVDLDILGNRITNCLQRELALLPEEVRKTAGYGGVSLADVEMLRLHDNIIEDNGPDHLQPVCGVYILHGEGLDIMRNRIINNGAKTDEKADDATAGRRGGIVVEFAMPGIVPLEVFEELRPRQNGVPAALIHDNIISQPLGRALSIRALGPVTVQGNNLTSRGVIPNLRAPGFLASTVYIGNLGLSNEIYFQTSLFSGPTADPDEFEEAPTADENFINLPATGIDDARLGQYLANGNVMFTNNQVLADLAEPEVSFALTSVVIFSLDDVVVTDNQINCNFLIDLLLSNIIVLGMSVRINDNRFNESLYFALFSSIGLGYLFNHTVDNQATHCMLSIESPLAGFPFFQPEIKERDNMVLMGWFSDNFCAAFSKFRKLTTNNQTGGVAGGPPSSGGSRLTETDLNLLR